MAMAATGEQTSVQRCNSIEEGRHGDNFAEICKQQVALIARR